MTFQSLPTAGTADLAAEIVVIGLILVDRMLRQFNMRHELAICEQGIPNTVPSVSTNAPRIDERLCTKSAIFDYRVVDLTSGGILPHQAT